MNGSTEKIENLINKYLGKSSRHIFEDWGMFDKKSENEIWFYKRYHLGFFHDKIAFIFEDHYVVGIIITEYFLWWELRCLLYYGGNSEKYKVVSGFNA
ncbi:hypothetical protein [Chryseobacterium sp. SIMBA_038]|uniref:hypothetical protein n=1 Tax=Chryseobacterium sp. SIMBA_038 TaxID=3085780 RepID=UPI003979420E